MSVAMKGITIAWLVISALYATCFRVGVLESHGWIEWLTVACLLIFNGIATYCVVKHPPAETSEQPQ